MINRRPVGATTITATISPATTVTARKDGILITRKSIAIRGHVRIMGEIGRATWNTRHVLSVRRNILENVAQTPRNVLTVVRKDTGKEIVLNASQKERRTTRWFLLRFLP